MENQFNVQNIRQAVLVQHERPTDNICIKARKYLDSLHNSDQCLDQYLLLCHTDERDEVRHFALQSIINVLKANLNRFSLHQKTEVKKIVLRIVSNGTKSVLDEKTFIKEKIAELVCAVAINGWPGNWRSFFKEIFVLSAESEKELEMVLRIVTSLRLQIQIDSRIALQKKEDVRQTLQSYSKEIYNLIEASFNFCQRVFKDDTTNGFNIASEIPSNIALKTSQTIIIAALDCLAANIQIPMDGIFTNSTVEYLCALADNPVFRRKALECLILITEKRPVIPNDMKTRHYNDKFFQIWCVLNKSVENLLSETSGDYREEKTRLDLLVDLSEQIVKNHKNVTFRRAENKCFKARFLSVLIAFFGRFGREPLTNVLDLFATLFSENFIDAKGSEILKGKICQICFERLERVSFFDCYDEPEDSKIELKLAVWRLLRSVMLHDRKLYMKIVIFRLRNLIAMKENAIAPEEILRRWEDFFIAVRVALSKECLGDSSVRERKDITKDCSAVLKLMISKRDNAAVVFKVVEFLPAFSSLLIYIPNDAKILLRHIFDAFRNPFVSSSLRNTRRIPLIALVNLSKTSKNALIPFYSILKAEMNEICRGDPKGENSIGFSECLLNISDDDSLREERQKLIVEIFRNCIANLCRCEMGDFFLKEQSEGVDGERKRKEILTVLESFISPLKSITKSPISYCDYQSAEAIPMHYPNARELYADLTPVLKTIFESIQRKKRHSKWSGEVLKAVLAIVSLYCNLQREFFTVDPLRLATRSVGDLGNQSICALQTIAANLISPLTIRCAAVAPLRLKTFVRPLLADFLRVLLVRLEENWERVEGDSQEELEELTTTVSQMVYSFSLETVHQREEKSPGNPQIRGGNESSRVLKDFLMSDETVSRPFCNLLALLMKMPLSHIRNNAYRFLENVARENRPQRDHLRPLVALMVEAMKTQKRMKEVDKDLVAFVAKVLEVMVRKDKRQTIDHLHSSLKEVAREDVAFLVNAFLARDWRLRKKKTKQFLLKLSGDEAVEVRFEKCGVLTRSVRRKTPKKNIQRNEITRVIDMRVLFDKMD